MKFKIGDRIQLKSKTAGYYIDSWKDTNHSYAIQPGDIVTVTAVSESNSYKGRFAYGFREDKEREDEAHWINVQSNFKLVDRSFEL